MKKQLKILNLIDIPWNSGLTDYAIKLSKVLINKGHKIYFAAPYFTSCYKVILQENFKIINISDRKNNFIFSDIFKISNFVKKNEIQVINAHTGRTQTIAIICSYFNKNLKVVRTKADIHISTRNIISKKLSKIICASEFIKQNCIKGYLNLNKLIVIPPYAPEFKIPMPIFPENRIFKIGILARLSPIKGHKYFLEAAKILISKGFKNLQFLIAGYETQNMKYQELKEYADALKISDYVKYEGKIETPEEFIKNCHIGIISSIGSEGVSRVLLEWMSAGRPVIATKVGCIPEILNPKYLIPPKRADIMAEKILNFVNSKPEFESAIRENKNTIEKKYNITLFSTRTEEEFLSIAYG